VAWAAHFTRREGLAADGGNGRSDGSQFCIHVACIRTNKEFNHMDSSIAPGRGDRLASNGSAIHQACRSQQRHFADLFAFLWPPSHGVSQAQNGAAESSPVTRSNRASLIYINWCKTFCNFFSHSIQASQALTSKLTGDFHDTFFMAHPIAGSAGWRMHHCGVADTSPDGGCGICRKID
jgi:hypothetical protein